MFPGLRTNTHQPGVGLLQVLLTFVVIVVMVVVIAGQVGCLCEVEGVEGVDYRLLRMQVCDVGLVVLVPIEVSQQLEVLLSLESPDGEELQVDFEPDKYEEKSCQDGDDAEEGPQVELVTDQEVEQEDQTTQDQDQQEDEMEDEPGEDQSQVEVDPTDDQEDVGEEPGEVGGETPRQDGVALVEREEGGAVHQARGEEEGAQSVSGEVLVQPLLTHLPGVDHAPRVVNEHVQLVVVGAELGHEAVYVPGQRSSDHLIHY